MSAANPLRDALRVNLRLRAVSQQLCGQSEVALVPMLGSDGRNLAQWVSSPAHAPDTEPLAVGEIIVKHYQKLKKLRPQRGLFLKLEHAT